LRILRYDELKEEFLFRKKSAPSFLVNKIINDVRKYGDEALRKYTLKFDGVDIKDFRITEEELEDAYKIMDSTIINSIRKSRKNIERFCRCQLKQLRNFKVEIAPGVIAEQRILPIERIGIYVPGGRFPLVSTVLMCGVPAIVAKVKEVVLCSPPGYNNTIHPRVLGTAKLLGIKEIYKIGGIQAIASLAYGTETIRPVDKIFGPGNIYVTTAKKIVFGDVGIDFIAGPTEILIIADDSAEPSIIAADLLAQAEHDTNAIPILVTDSPKLGIGVKEEIKRQLVSLKTREIAEKSIRKNGMIILVENLDEAIDFANKKAPEHLELQVKNPKMFIAKLKNYGSLFIGRYASEVLGDYSSGLNHTLPTNRSARYTGGLHIKDFLKFQTILRVNKKGLKIIGPIAESLAQIEGLDGHLNSITIRR